MVWRYFYNRAVISVLLTIAFMMTPDGLRASEQETADLSTIHLLKREGFDRSQVMDVAFALTDVHGPRLTGSPASWEAGKYARDTLQKWGLSDVRLEPWHFGSGWSNDLFWARMVTPQPFPLIGYPRAWTPGTDGVVRAQVVLLKAKTAEELASYTGKLAGRIVLIDPEAERPENNVPNRFDEEDLTRLSLEPDPSVSRAPRVTAAMRELMKARQELLVAEGVAAVLESTRQAADGAVMVAGSGSRRDTDPPVSPSVILSKEHYGRIRRLLESGFPVEIELEIRNEIHGDQLDSFNVVGEIQGKELPEEIVLIGAHLDSWHAGTGATDNAAGCAVMMEAMRILSQSGVRLRRTVRIALWMGEEQGLLGSQAYVAQHLIDNGLPEKSHSRFSGYFNLDAGSGAIRGVYLEGNELAAPIFSAWLQPLENLGMTTISIRPGGPGSSDQRSFDRVGLPAFQFIQDPLGYDNWTHHTNADTFEGLHAGDLMRNAVIVASFAYHAANREELLPRKPEKPSP